MVANPRANLCSSNSYLAVRNMRPPSRSAAWPKAVLISFHTMSPTCRVVGPVTMAFAGDLECIHHNTARAAAQSFPEPLHPTTETLLDRATALRISVCLSYGFSLSTSLTNSTGS